MRRASWLLVACVIFASCQDTPLYVQPSLPPPLPTIPQTITITATAGLGASAGQVFIAANVRDASGLAVGNTTVRFATTAGVVQPASVLADGGGLAQATVTTSGPATVTASAGTVTVALTVTPSPPAVAPTPQLPVNPPTPPTTEPSVPLTVSIIPVAAPSGSPTTFGLVAQGGLAFEVWTFGDGSPALTTTSHTASHVYTSAGVYPVTVTVRDLQGRAASSAVAITIEDPPTTTAPPAAGLTVVMTCTIAARNAVCNLAASYNGTPLQSTPPTFQRVDWDWGDGTSTLVTTGSPLGTRTYTQAGTYIVSPHVTVRTPAGDQTVILTRPLTIP